jgi:hypothetical protein
MYKYSASQKTLLIGSIESEKCCVRSSLLFRSTKSRGCLVTGRGVPYSSCAFFTQCRTKNVLWGGVGVSCECNFVLIHQLPKYVNRFFLNIESAGSSETLVTTPKTVRYYNPNDHNLNLHRPKTPDLMQIEDIE